MRGTEVSEFIDLAYIWQERATEAEVEVERLKTELKKEQKWVEHWHYLLEKSEAENALLRKVEEVGEIMWGDAICHRCNARECRGCSAHDFKKALSEYQSWKKGQK